MTIRIGTAGWSYDHWQGVLYPPRAPVGKRLAYYLARYNTVELNASFYRWPRDSTFTRWRDLSPPGFQMSVKASRGLTHARRLDQPEIWIGRIERGVRQLGETLGVVLAQLPPDLEDDQARLARFLAHWPRGIKLAVEFRHPSWHHEGTYRLLAAQSTAYCVMSGAGLPCIERVTAPFVYLRFHGPDPNQLYGGSYDQASLGRWAERIRDWQRQRLDVFAYFNNDQSGFAVQNADALKRLLEQ